MRTEQTNATVPPYLNSVLHAAHDAGKDRGTGVKEALDALKAFVLSPKERETAQSHIQQVADRLWK